MSGYERAVRWRDVWSPFWWRVVWVLLGLSVTLLIVGIIVQAVAPSA